MRDVEHEDHLSSLAQREASRLKADSAALESQASFVQEQISSYQKKHYALTEKLESAKEQMKWAEAKLLEWSLAAKQKDDDFKVIEQ